MSHAESPATAKASTEQRRWRINLRWIAGLLLVWFVVTFVISWHARALTFSFFDWPFSFWVGAQGALLVYLLIVTIYAWRMNRLDDPPETTPEQPSPTPPLQQDL
jgi:putative solute:sodium symporter small subunit